MPFTVLHVLKAVLCIACKYFVLLCCAGWGLMLLLTP
jgi:hypothetical protein